MTLTAQLPAGTDPDDLFDAFSSWAAEQGLTLYPAQAEALIEVVSNSHVILSTPTGSGKSLVATGAHFAALARGVRRAAGTWAASRRGGRRYRGGPGATASVRNPP